MSDQDIDTNREWRRQDPHEWAHQVEKRLGFLWKAALIVAVVAGVNIWLLWQERDRLMDENRVLASRLVQVESNFELFLDCENLTQAECAELRALQREFGTPPPPGFVEIPNKRKVYNTETEDFSDLIELDCTNLRPEVCNELQELWPYMTSSERQLFRQGQ